MKGCDAIGKSDGLAQMTGPVSRCGEFCGGDSAREIGNQVDFWALKVDLGGDLLKFCQYGLHQR